MNVALWIVQIVLAAIFLMAGLIKLFLPLSKLQNQLPWVADVPAFLVRLIGLAELVGVLGLILPTLTQTLPWLTVLAAVGLGLLVILAAAFHIYRREFPNIIPTVVLLTLAILVAYGRWEWAPVMASSF